MSLTTTALSIVLGTVAGLTLYHTTGSVFYALLLTAGIADLFGYLGGMLEYVD